jgi:hypothetical protein
VISCTEFIPSYSELFSFLDENFGGHAEVERFWKFLFEPDGKGIPLINFAKKNGLRGCWDYSTGTLTEEAADVTRYLNEKQGWIYSEMHYCPSKGRLLEYEKTIGLKPYYDYCGHCDYYRSAYDLVGLKYFRNHLNVDKASCSMCTIDPKVFRGVMTFDENTVVMKIRSKEQEYFHRDFHSSLNMGIHYMGSVHGLERLKDFLVRYTKNVYVKTIEKAKLDPLKAVEDRIKETYTLEKALDALKLENDGETLTVKIAYCPAVKHLKKTGREVIPFFRYSTETVMETIAKETGLDFVMDSYNEESGEAAYHFTKK